MKESVYIINDGELKRKNNTLYFDNKEESKYIPVNDIEELYILGEVTISKKALELCTKQHIILHFYNYHDYYVGSYYPREHYNSGYMVLKQAEYYLDIDKRRILAEKFIVGSAKNIGSIIFLVGLTISPYRFTLTSASLDMNLRQYLEIFIPTVKNSRTVLFSYRRV